MVERTTIEDNTPESWKTIVLTYMFWQVSQYFLRSLDRWLSVVVCSCSGEHQEGQWLVAFVFYQKNSCSTVILLSFGQFRMPHQEPKARLSSYSFDQELILQFQCLVLQAACYEGVSILARQLDTRCPDSLLCERQDLDVTLSVVPSQKFCKCHLLNTRVEVILKNAQKTLI